MATQPATAPSRVDPADNHAEPKPAPSYAAGPRLSFFQLPWVQNVLPFATSLALHVGIILLGITIWQVKEQIQKAVVQEQIVVPDSALAEGVPGGVENTGIGEDPTRPAAQDEYQNASADGWAPKPGESPVAAAMGGGSGDSADAIIGLGSGGFGRGSGLGGGAGDGSGSAAGDGRGRLAPFGAPDGGIPGPRGRVFGNGGNARTIAFVCDSSGSMIDKFSSLKNELGKAIEGLRPIQSFSLVFFRDEKATTFENGSLVAATPENKRKAYKWLEEIGTAGTSDPIPGLEAAFKGKPELVYILTDGDFPNNNKVMSTVAQLNREKRSRVNTIAFVSSKSDDSQSFLDFLKKLASDNGGAFRHVALDELD